MLTETDFLRRLKVDTFLELLLAMLDESFELRHRCHETQVSAAMTIPAITVTRDASFAEVVNAFQKHDGRSTPIVDSEGRLLGVLLRKDFIAAFHQGSSR
jgi:CBS-domain-containing membrane protein